MNKENAKNLTIRRSNTIYISLYSICFNCNLPSLKFAIYRRQCLNGKVDFSIFVYCYKKEKKRKFLRISPRITHKKDTKENEWRPNAQNTKMMLLPTNVEQTHKGNDQMINAFLQTRRGWPVTCPFSEHCSDEQLAHSSTSILARPPQGHSGRSFRSQTKRHFLRRC